MDCRIFKDLVEAEIKNGALKALSAEGERHLQSCATCRSKYAPLLSGAKAANKNGSGNAGAKKFYPSADDLFDRFPDISDPVEFKDAPLTFTLYLDDREEEIKMVEPKLDYPLPVDGRLVVREEDTSLTDVAFKFNPEDDRPYELHFTVKAGLAYAEPHVVRYGGSEHDDKGFSALYTERIVDRGGVKAWIEMKRGTARIYIRYVSAKETG